MPTSQWRQDDPPVAGYITNGDLHPRIYHGGSITTAGNTTSWNSNEFTITYDYDTAVQRAHYNPHTVAGSDVVAAIAPKALSGRDWLRRQIDDVRVELGAAA